MDDKVVSGGVKRRLARHHIAPITGVRVDTFEGTVYLTGHVDTPEQKDEAERAARRVAGVEQVVNDLVVDGAVAVPAALPDFRLRNPLNERLPGIARVEPGLPGAPDLAYDHGGRVVASIYTVAWDTLVSGGLTSLPATGRPIDHVSMYALSPQPDRPSPNYAVVLWHVSEREAAALR